MKPHILRGVPPSLKQDGWWLDPFARPGTGKGHGPRALYMLHSALLAGLIAVTQLPAASGAATGQPSPQVTACTQSGLWGFHAALRSRSLPAALQSDATS